MTTHKNVPMTSKEAIELITMLSARVEANKTEIENAPALVNMREEESENTRLEWMIKKLDTIFWTKEGELK